MSTESGPVVIGGVGGSGTRLPAQLLRDLGFFLGGDLSGALDNLWFGMLFRRPEWCRSRPAQIPISLRLFAKAMQGDPRLEAAELAILREAVLQHGQHAWAYRFARSMIGSQGPPNGAVGWGWKNPSTHIFIEQLAAAFPEMKYVHVIRNGFSLTDKVKSARQVHSWGPMFGLERPSDPHSPTPGSALRYWIRANQRVLALAPELFGDRFMLLRYEFICHDPWRAGRRLAEFVGASADATDLARFAASVSPPTNAYHSSGRTEFLDVDDMVEAREMLGYQSSLFGDVD